MCKADLVRFAAKEEVGDAVAAASWTAAVPCRFRRHSPSDFHLVVVLNPNSVRLEPVNRIDHRLGSNVFKPSSRAPWILVGHGDRSVLDRVLMDVVQPRQIRVLVTQPRFPVVEPHFSLRRMVQSVDPDGSLCVQHFEHGSQTCSIVVFFGRVSNEMVMVGKYRPRFQSPAKVLGDGQQASLQNVEPFPASKIVGFFVSSRRDKKTSLFGQLVSRRVRPRSFRVRHNEDIDLPTPERQAEESHAVAAASWTAAVPCRFRRHSPNSFHVESACLNKARTGPATPFAFRVSFDLKVCPAAKAAGDCRSPRRYRDGGVQAPAAPALSHLLISPFPFSNS